MDLEGRVQAHRVKLEFKEQLTEGADSAERQPWRLTRTTSSGDAGVPSAGRPPGGSCVPGVFTLPRLCLPRHRQSRPLGVAAGWTSTRPAEWGSLRGEAKRWVFFSQNAFPVSDAWVLVKLSKPRRNDTELRTLLVWGCCQRAKRSFGSWCVPRPLENACWGPRRSRGALCEDVAGERRGEQDGAADTAAWGRCWRAKGAADAAVYRALWRSRTNNHFRVELSNFKKLRSFNLNFFELSFSEDSPKHLRWMHHPWGSWTLPAATHPPIRVVTLVKVRAPVGRLGMGRILSPPKRRVWKIFRNLGLVAYIWSNNRGQMIWEQKLELGMMYFAKEWDKLPTSTGAGFLPSTEVHQSIEIWWSRCFLAATRISQSVSD